MNYEVYAYWNLAQLEGAFNAIAALTNSADFTGLLRLLALVAIVSLVLAVLSGRARHEDFWRWVIMLAVINGMLLVPKSTVVLVDRTSSQPNRVVSNVPIGLAALAHGTSKIGDWLTRAYETVFALPTDLQFQQNGLMFGHRVLTENTKVSPELVNGVWMRDFQEFWRECVMPDIASGYLNVDQLRVSHDFWSELSGTNPALYVTLSTFGYPIPCPNAYADLTNRLNSQVVPALIQLEADTNYPGVVGNATRMRNAIATVYSYSLGVTSLPENIVKQQASINAAVTAYCQTFAQLGDSNKASVCYSSTQGAYQTNYTYQVLSKIAESSMPKLKTAIELIQYAVFPIIVAFAVVAGHMGFGVLKAYLMSLVWVQLWPPLYAVVHYIQTSSLSNYAGQLAGLGDTMSGQTSLLQLGISDQAIAGMLVVAIPPIAAALVKGGEVGLQAVAGLVSAPRTAERQAADNAKGNESVGQWNAAPMVRTADGAVLSHMHASGVVERRMPDGTTAFDASGIAHQANLRLNMGSRITAGLQRQSEQAETAAAGNLVSAATSTAAAIQQAADFIKGHSQGERSGTHWGMSDAAGFTSAVTTAQRLTESFAKKHGLDQSQAAQILGMAEASMHNPKALDLVSPLSVGAAARATGTSEVAARQLLEDARNFAKESGFSEAVDKVRRATREASFDTSDESTRRAMEGIRASFDRSQQHLDQSSASYQNSLAFKEAAARARENAGAWDAGMLRPFVDWMTTQRNEQDLYGRNFDRDTVFQMAEKNPEALQPFVERFFKERIEPNLGNGVGDLKTPEDVRAFYGHSKGQIPDAAATAAQGQAWIQQTRGQAANAGVDPNARVRSNLPGQVAADQGKAGQAISAGQHQVQAGGAPLQGQVQNQTAPASQPLLGLAATNAAAQLFPDSVSKSMLDKLPGVNMSIGVHGAAAAEAAAERASAGHPRDPVQSSLVAADKAIGQGVSNMLPESVNKDVNEAMRMGGMGD